MSGSHHRSLLPSVKINKFGPSSAPRLCQSSGVVLLRDSNTLETSFTKAKEDGLEKSFTLEARGFLRGACFQERQSPQNMLPWPSPVFLQSSFCVKRKLVSRSEGLSCRPQIQSKSSFKLVTWSGDSDLHMKSRRMDGVQMNLTKHLFTRLRFDTVL